MTDAALTSSTPGRPQRLAVITVNYASCQLLEANLARTIGDLRQHAPGTRPMAVVVDNFSSTQERERVVAVCHRHGFESVLLEDNNGFGAGVNAGVAYGFAKGADAVLLLNPDAWIDAASVTRLLDEVDLRPRTLTTPVVRRPDGSIWSAAMDLYVASGQVRATRFRPASTPESAIAPWASGACLMISRQLWSEVGGFDDDYFMYWEDIDLSHKVREAGGELAVVEDATAVHDESGTQDLRGGRRSTLFYYYNTRNRLIFAAKHLPRPAQRGWLRESLANARRLLRPEDLRLITHPSTTIAPVIRGELAGRSYLRRRRMKR